MGTRETIYSNKKFPEVFWKIEQNIFWWGAEFATPKYVSLGNIDYFRLINFKNQGDLGEDLNTK